MSPRSPPLQSMMTTPYQLASAPSPMRVSVVVFPEPLSSGQEDVGGELVGKLQVERPAGLAVDAEPHESGRMLS